MNKGGFVIKILISALVLLFIASAGYSFYKGEKLTVGKAIFNTERDTREIIEDISAGQEAEPIQNSPENTEADVNSTNNLEENRTYYIQPLGANNTNVTYNSSG